MAAHASWTPFGEYDPTQRETPNPFAPVEDLVLVFDPFPHDHEAKPAAAPSTVVSSSSVPHISPPVVVAPPVLPKPISEWKQAEFHTPIAAKAWGPTPPCISGVPKQSGETPGKQWQERHVKKKALKASEKTSKGGALEVSVKQKDPFHRLSDDVMARICLNFDVSEILRLALLNKQWARVAANGTLWKTLLLRNLTNNVPYGILHFGFDRTQVWLEEPAPKYWRKIYLSKVRDLANQMRKKSGGWKVFSKPEVFVDVIEKLRVHCAVSGRVLHAEITGSITAECHLPDYAAQCELKANLTESPKFPRVVLDDVTFHNAVDSAAFASPTEPRVLFRPPSAGPFEVMRYRVATQKQRVPFSLEAMYLKDLDKHAYEVQVMLKSNFKEGSKAMTDITVYVPVPKASYVKTVTKVSGGEAEYQTRSNVIVWKIASLAGNKPLQLTSTVQIPKGEALDWTRPPLELECAPFLYNVSGLRCLGFVLPESKEKPQSWVRYTTVISSFKHDV